MVICCLSREHLEKKMKPPVDDIVPRSFPKIKPEDGTALYFQSKSEARKLKKIPEWDYARDSITMSLLEAQKQLHLSELRLVDKRVKRVKKNKEFADQWAELKIKENVFKQSFQKFNKFVRENQEKRDRAEKRIVEEKELQFKRESDIERLMDDIQYLTTIKSKMDQRIKEYRMFDDYLGHVAKASLSIFKNPTDIITRFEALIDTKHVLGKAQQEVMNALETARVDMIKLIEDKSLILMGLNNKLADLQGRYDSAKSNSLAMETLLARVQEESSHKLSDIIDVKTSCYNTYKTMCHRLGAPLTFAVDDFEQQLVFIKRVLLQVSNVNKKAKKLCAKEQNSLKVEAKSLLN